MDNPPVGHAWTRKGYPTVAFLGLGRGLKREGPKHMPKQESLEAKLARHIENTGYPLEIEISNVLENSDWMTSGSLPYLDPEEPKLRETDIYAFFTPPFTIDLPKMDTPLFTPLMLVECKKSAEHSLVLFPRQKISSSDIEGQVFDYPVLMGEKNPSPNGSSVLVPFVARRTHFNTMEACNSYTLTKPNESRGKPDVFEAVVTLVKALNFFMDEIKRKKQPLVKDMPHHPIMFCYLVIAFDGPMFQAKVNEQGHVRLRRSQHEIIRFAWNPRVPTELIYYSIDVVHRKYFEDYLRRIRSDIEIAASSTKSDKELVEYLKTPVTTQ